MLLQSNLSTRVFKKSWQNEWKNPHEKIIFSLLSQDQKIFLTKFEKRIFFLRLKSQNRKFNIFLVDFLFGRFLCIKIFC